MAETHSPDDMWSIFVDLMDGFGFDRMLYGFTRFANEQGVGQLKDAIVLSRQSPEYMEYFIGKEMYFYGPMTSWAASQQGCCSWSLIDQKMAAGELGKKQLEVVEINRKFGLTAGYTISFHSPDTMTKAAIGLAAKDGHSQDDVDQLWRAHGDTIHLINMIMHLQVCRLPSVSDTSRSLTARQRDVLQKMASGKGIDQIAEEMDLNAATVNKHLRLARETLGARTTAQAVAAAARSNIFLNIKS